MYMKYFAIMGTFFFYLSKMHYVLFYANKLEILNKINLGNLYFPKEYLKS